MRESFFIFRRSRTTLPGMPNTMELSGISFPSPTSACALIKHPTNFRSVQHRRTDTDQAVIANCTSMQHGLMADSHIGAQRQRTAHISMQHSTVLNIGIFADNDWVIVATQHGIEPNARIF